MPSKETQNQPAPITTRMFWTWDHSTDWALNKAGAQTIGDSNHYGRTTEVLVQYYTNLLAVVWQARHRRHSGVGRLCDVARATSGWSRL